MTPLNRKSAGAPPGKPPRAPGPLSGLSRREFLQASGLAALLAALKPAPVWSKSEAPPTGRPVGFTASQRAAIAAVQMHLFPDDGDGPSARDLNALSYLEWALTDPDNIADGDQAFLARGCGWLDELAREEHGRRFVKLTTTQQHALLEKTAASSAGQNWMSLLIYYLIEALLLDPLYGGNPDQIGWRWLNHQPGFPRPTPGHGYRRYPT